MDDYADDKIERVYRFVRRRESGRGWHEKAVHPKVDVRYVRHVVRIEAGESYEKVRRVAG